MELAGRWETAKDPSYTSLDTLNEMTGKGLVADEDSRDRCRK